MHANIRVMAGFTPARGVSGLPRCLFDRGYLADAARPGTTILLEHASADPPGAQTFRPGQAVLQWWAAWMRDCNTLGSAPQSYSNKKGAAFSRPAWFSGEVLAVCGCAFHGGCLHPLLMERTKI